MSKKIYKFIIIFIIFNIFLIHSSNGDILLQHCNAQTNVCIFNLISNFFDEPILFKSNTSSGKVKDVYFENSNVPPFEKIFQFFPHLEHFVIENCELKTLDRGSFENATNLQVLRVQFNQIEKLISKNFELATELREIRLDHNKISDISLNAFDRCENVTILSLQHNLIENISVPLFESMPLLNYLDLSYNRIERIDAEIFEKNTELKTIILNNNRIVSFDSNTFMRFEHLDYLDLSFNVIIEIWVQNVNKLILNNAVLKACHINGSVEVLVANNNFLKGVDIHDESDLRTLEVKNNSIENIANFSNAFLLEHFDLSANNLKVIDAGKLFNYPRLVSLKLAATELRSLTDETFMFQSDLKELDLSHNYLGHITSALLEPMKILEKLSISANNLKSFEYENLRETHTRLKEIDLQYNKWNCSFLAEMLQYLQFNGIMIKTDYGHKTVKDKSQVSGIFCEDDMIYSSSAEDDTKSNLSPQSSSREILVQPSDYGTHLVINSLIFVMVLVLLLFQVVKFIKYYNNNRLGLGRIRQGRSNHSRLMEETEHL